VKPLLESEEFSGAKFLYDLTGDVCHAKGFLRDILTCETVVAGILKKVHVKNKDQVIAFTHLVKLLTGTGRGRTLIDMTYVTERFWIHYTITNDSIKQPGILQLQDISSERLHLSNINKLAEPIRNYVLSR
jgi:hypothetical protein